MLLMVLTLAAFQMAIKEHCWTATEMMTNTTSVSSHYSNTFTDMQIFVEELG
jgi:hypothetical protein